MGEFGEMDHLQGKIEVDIEWYGTNSSKHETRYVPNQMHVFPSKLMELSRTNK